MEKRNKKDQETQDLSSQGFTPSFERLKAVNQEVTHALEASKDDPCYPVYHEKEVTRRLVGLEMPWVKCIPIEIFVVWNVEECGGRKNENQARYTIEEGYPGYIKIEYDQQKMDEIKGFYIAGPSPPKPDHVKASLSEVLATFHVYRGPDILEKVVTTNDPSDFAVHRGKDLSDARIAISNNVPNGISLTNINSVTIIPSKKLVKYPVAGILETLDGGTINVSVGSISIEEILRGLREGKLTKQFAVHEFTDYTPLPEVFRRDGTATVCINFAAMRERWEVIINTINVMGNGTHDRAFGIQVHTERRVEIVIESEEFKSAEGKTSFVSITPYSIPEGMFGCQEETIEVAGSGTDIDAERYDQVRHAKRFNPPQNPHDEALKQEWLKIEKSKTPYAFPKTYSVKGTKSGTQVDLFFPKDSGYVVAYRCDPGDDFVKEWQQKWLKKWAPNERRSQGDCDRFLFPETVRILLKDNWYTEHHYYTKYYGPNVGWKVCEEAITESWPENTDKIEVRRIE